VRAYRRQTDATEVEFKVARSDAEHGEERQSSRAAFQELAPRTEVVVGLGDFVKRKVRRWKSPARAKAHEKRAGADRRQADPHAGGARRPHDGRYRHAGDDGSRDAGAREGEHFDDERERNDGEQRAVPGARDCGAKSTGMTISSQPAS